LKFFVSKGIVLMATELSQNNRFSTASGSLHVVEKRSGLDRRAGDDRVGDEQVDRRVGNNHRPSLLASILTSSGFIKSAVWISTIAFIAASFWVYYAASTHKLFYKPSSGFGYYIGIIGGVMMLLMLLYPIRKHMAFARNWGAVRYWFSVHMLFGIAGPVLVLFHSTYHLKSLNATMATYSMLLVALSGIVGRFIYKHIHHGLYGRKATLDELQHDMDTCHNTISSVDSIVMEAAGVGEQLKKFRDMAFAKDMPTHERAWRFMTIGWQRRLLLRKCRWELKQAVRTLSGDVGWSKWQQKKHYFEALFNVEEYLKAVQQTAQFDSYERLFRLWHLLHSPFVWMLAITGIVHVIAVNMY